MELEPLLLDEIMSAFGPERVVALLNVIREVARAGTTLLIATHELGFAGVIASPFCFLHAGLVLEQGSPGKVFSHPREART
jgi:polar amino acid transport system ATP-binding protein